MKRAPWVLSVLVAFGLGWLTARWFGAESRKPASTSTDGGSSGTSTQGKSGSESGAEANVPTDGPSDSGDGPTGEAGAALANGGAPAEEPELARCRPRIALESLSAGARSRRDGAQAELTLVNDCDETVLSAWVDFEGVERDDPSIILAKATRSFRTYVGHVFRLRLANGSRTLLREVTMPETAAARLSVCGCGPDERSAASPPPVELVDAGRPDRGPVPSCLVPYAPEPRTTAPSHTLSGRYSLTFRNTCASTQVVLSWVDFDGGLRPTATLAAGATLDHSSFVGHEWRLRDGNTQRWIRDFALDGGAVVDLCDCPP